MSLFFRKCILPFVMFATCGISSSAFAQSVNYTEWIKDVYSTETYPGNATIHDKSLTLIGNGPKANWSLTFSVPPPGPGLGCHVSIWADRPEQNATLAEIFPTGVIDSPVHDYLFNLHPNNIGYGLVWVPAPDPPSITVHGEIDLSKVKKTGGEILTFHMTGGVLDEHLTPENEPIGDNQGAVLIWHKPGIPLQNAPAIGMVSHCPDGTCQTPEAESRKPGQPIPGLNVPLASRYFNDALGAQLPDGCTSCGGSGGLQRLLVDAQSGWLDIERKTTPNNLFWPTNAGRGVFLNYDYSLKIFSDGGQSVALLSDPNLGMVLKFREIMVPDTDPSGNPTGQPILPTGNYEPIDHAFYGVLELRDDGGNAALDPPVDAETKIVHATVMRRNGEELKFRLADRFSGRIEQITTPDGAVFQISYRADFEPPIGFTDQQEIDSPTRLTQIYQVTGPFGRMAEFEYHGLKKAGRWAVSDIEITSTEFPTGDHLQYVYGADGFIKDVNRKRPGATGYVPSCVYTYSNPSSYSVIETEQWNGQRMVKDRMLVSADYRLAALSAVDNIENYQGTDANEFGGLGDTNLSVANAMNLANQVMGVMFGKENGVGQRYLTIYKEGGINPDPESYRLLYRGKSIEWAAGRYLRYLKSTPSAPGDFSTGSSENDNDPSTIYANFSTGTNVELTMEQRRLNIPPKSRDENGIEREHEYDANHNLKKSVYYDGANNALGTSEQWLYNDASQLIRYRDRDDNVVLYDRDSNGRIERIVRGLKDNGSGGEIADPQAMQQLYHYTTVGLMDWEAYVPLSLGPTPPVDYRTSYEYDSNFRIKTITKPAIQTEIGQLTRPSVSYVWTDGKVQSMTDEKGNVISYEYDNYARLIRTNYAADQTNEETFYQVSGQTYRKARNNVVSRTIHDNAYRMTRRELAFSKDTNILDGNVGTANSLTEQDRTDYYYFAGWTTPYYSLRNGNASRTDFDYRGRGNKTLNWPCNGSYTRTITSYWDNRPFQTSKTTSQMVGGRSKAFHDIRVQWFFCAESTCPDHQEPCFKYVVFQQ